MSLIIGWVVLTVVAIGVSSAAVGNVGERVSPQPASVLQAAGDVVAFASDSEPDEPSEPTTPPTSTIIDPADAATAVPSTSSAGSTTTTGAPSSTSPPSPTTTRAPSDTTTTTTVVDKPTTTTTTSTTTTTTTVPTEPPTTTIPPDEVRRRTINSDGGWIRIAWTDEWLRLRRAGSEFGFKFELVENTGTRIEVRFIGKTRISRIVVELVDGKARHEVFELRRED